MPPSRIAKPALQHVRRERPEMSRKHLDNVKTLLCCVCGRPAHDPHHLMHPAHGPNSRGTGRKSADRWAVPVCRPDHDAIGTVGDDEAWLAARGVDGRALANALWAAREDYEEMVRVNFRFLQSARLKKDTRPLSGIGVE